MLLTTTTLHALSLSVSFYNNTFLQIPLTHVIDNIQWMVHNSSILSAAGERNPDLAKQINVIGGNAYHF
jgi:hypothetical protein